MNDKEHTFRPVGFVRSDFRSRFGTPRQSGLAKHTISYIEFEKEFRREEFFRGITEFSHLWLIWEFSENRERGYSPTVRPPRLGGNKRRGVFATRSPFRPNPLGLSCVKLEELNFDKNTGPVLVISGADLLDGTPVYDIKPYLPQMESIPDARGGFTDTVPYDTLDVRDPDRLLTRIPPSKRQGLVETLSLDPRPSYQKDDSRIYGILFAGYNVQFQTDGKTLFLTNLTKEKE